MKRTTVETARRPRRAPPRGGGCRPQRPRRHRGAHRRDPGRRGGAIAALLVDAGPYYAYVDADDAHHRESLDLLSTHPGLLLVPSPVVTEVAHLLGSRLGTHAEVRLLGDLASGAFIVEAVAAGDWLRVAELAWRYRNLPLGTVDASLVAAAERLGVRVVATFDRRHLSAVRPAHIAAFDLLP